MHDDFVLDGKRMYSPSRRLLTIQMSPGNQRREQLRRPPAPQQRPTPDKRATADGEDATSSK